MKYLFAALLALLVVASVITAANLPDARSDVPVISWVTDKNPARDDQVALFHRWCLSKGYTVEADPGEASGDGRPGDPLPVVDGRKPAVKLTLDIANRDTTKQIMQGVSGVGGDMMDIGGFQLPYFQAIGLVKDVTAEADSLGYGPGETWAAIVPDLSVDGEQYLFPCNVTVHLYWINKKTFAKAGVPVPPRRWTVDEFERQGRAFVEAANKGGGERIFFVADVGLAQIYRSMGLANFNETGTACTLGDARYARCLQYYYDWTYRDRLIPSASDLASFDSQQGYGGPTLQLFNRGNIAMFASGRYALIQLRKFPDMELAVCEPPHVEMPNTLIGTRAAGVYVGSKHPEWAARFQQYLASEDYNTQVVRDADALPPNPKYTKTELFLRPPDHPEEWGLHEAFSGAAEEIAVAGDYSPFVLDADLNRQINENKDKVMNDLATPERAARDTASAVNEYIARTVAGDPALRAEYDRRVAIQKRIESLRAEGKKVPLDLISSPYHRRYYVFKGWSDPPADPAALPPPTPDVTPGAASEGAASTVTPDRTTPPERPAAERAAEGSMGSITRQPLAPADAGPDDRAPAATPGRPATDVPATTPTKPPAALPAGTSDETEGNK